MGPQRKMHIHGHIGVFASVFTGALYFYLGKRYLVRAFAADVFVTEALALYMPQCQTRQAMLLMHFQHITLQHGVMHKSLHLHVIVRHHMAVIFDVLA